ncbi:MAG: DUF2141 domain-containing protein [Planctomycetaceae bacterium]
MARNIEATESTEVRSSGLKAATILAVIVSALWFMRQRQPESPSPPLETQPPPAPTVSTEPAAIAAPLQQTVVVQVSGLKTRPAAVMVAVFLTDEGFPDVTSASITAEQDAKEELAEIPMQLPLSGMAAVAVFQDLDGNGVLTKNVVGLPTEPYGFSKNARATFGPPPFDAAAVDLATITEPLQISVR